MKETIITDDLKEAIGETLADCAHEAFGKTKTLNWSGAQDLFAVLMDDAIEHNTPIELVVAEAIEQEICNAIENNGGRTYRANLVEFSEWVRPHVAANAKYIAG